ncbi:MAG: DUF3108 domain-containing protein [Sterolibacterium sp.]|nr:DUF3108 domain-containing protein [Sterolibacterium sp.]
MTQRLALALLFSLLLHLGLLVAPGWYLPASDEALSPESPSLLEAHLAPALVRKTAVPSSHSAPRQHKTRQPIAPTSPAPGVGAPAIELPPALPPNMTEPPPRDSAGTASTVPSEPATPVATASNATGVPPEPALPQQGSIRFAISRGDQGFVIGQSLHRWRHDGKRYTLSSVTETTGIAAVFKPARVMQSSEGEIGAAGLRPSEFRTEKNGVAGDAASFNWTGMKVMLSSGGQREMPLVSGAQDMLSMFYQISAVFPWPAHEISEIMVATGRKFERYAFEVLGEETLATRQGDMRTLHLRSAAGVEAIDIWAALDLHGLPLKIRYTDRQGDRFDQIAEDIELDGMQVSTRKP